jgi:hypothetical protein
MAPKDLGDLQRALAWTPAPMAPKIAAIFSERSPGLQRPWR